MYIYKYTVIYIYVLQHLVDTSCILAQTGEERGERQQGNRLLKSQWNCSGALTQLTSARRAKLLEDSRQGVMFAPLFTLIFLSRLPKTASVLQ